jgi:hypothetical protein
LSSLPAVAAVAAAITIFITAEMEVQEVTLEALELTDTV